MHSDKRHSDKRQGGFSLLEMLVVLTMLTVVLGSVFALMKNSMTVSNTTYELNEAQQGLRTAHEFMRRDLIMAGAGLNGISIEVPQGFVTNYLAQNLVTDPLKPGYVNLPIIYSDANVPASVAVTGSNPATTVLTGTDRITILAVDSTFNPITIASGSLTSYGATASVAHTDALTVNTGEIYCFTSASGAAFGTITGMTVPGSGNATLNFAAGSSYGLNNPVAAGLVNVLAAGNSSGTSTQAVSLMRVKIIHYYVNNKQQLMRRVFGVPGAAFTDNIVAEHIAATVANTSPGLWFRYFVNLTNSNGTIQQPYRQLTTSTQQNGVRMIEVNLSAETTHNVNFTAANGNANSNSNSNSGTVTGSRQRIGMTSSITVRDLQFRNAQQPTSGG
jgi:prepilin-type N-terminal cleavage/methylation domain-containing protein